MSRGDRGQGNASLRDPLLIIGIISAIGLAWFVGALGGRDAERRDSYPQEYAATAKQHAARACVGREPATVFECVYEFVEASQDQAQAEQDLTAQQEMAKWALLMTGASFGTLALTGVALWFIKGTLDATTEMAVDTKTMADESAKATRAMMHQVDVSRAAERSYIFIEPSQPRIEEWMKGQGLLEWSFRLYNAGRTPATVKVVKWMLFVPYFPNTFDISSAPATTKYGDELTIPTIRYHRSAGYPVLLADDRGDEITATSGPPLIALEMIPERAFLADAAHNCAGIIWLKVHALYEDVWGGEHESESLHTVEPAHTLDAVEWRVVEYGGPEHNRRT